MENVDKLEDLKTRLKDAEDSYHISDLAAMVYHKLLKEIEELEEVLRANS